MRRVNCDVPEETFRKVKAYAGENGLKMPDAVNRLLREALRLDRMQEDPESDQPRGG